MQRIGLIGSDNSHVARFTEILNWRSTPPTGPRAARTVWAIWGDDEALTAEEARKGLIPVVASSPEEVADACDLVFATSRRPNVHVAHARPAIEARKPLFVDKPLAQTPDQCRELLALAEGRRYYDDVLLDAPVRLGGQLIPQRAGPGRSGEVRHLHGACTRRNEYGGIIFYGIHVAELMQEFHGADIVSVEAVESPAGGEPSNISAACTYEDGTLVTLGLIGDGVYIFHMLAVGSEGIVEVPGTARNYAADALSRKPRRGPGDRHACRCAGRARGRPLREGRPPDTGRPARRGARPTP